MEVFSLSLRLVAYSTRLRNLAQLAHARFRVLELLPADWYHVVARLARGHDDTEIVGCGREVVIGLIAKRDLNHP